MTLFFTLLPLYLFGNFHCLGMCGPLVALLGRHPYRLWYFLGRILSFTLAGAVAGAMGVILDFAFQAYHFSEVVAFVFGGGMILWGMMLMLRLQPLPSLPVPSTLARLQLWGAQFLLKESPLSTAFFGFLTVLLPCGQSLLVFSACALTGNLFVGALNGLAFALLTTPSLLLALHLLPTLKKFPRWDSLILGMTAITVGILTCCRGLAAIGWISHLVLNPTADAKYHLLLY